MREGVVSTGAPQPAMPSLCRSLRLPPGVPRMLRHGNKWSGSKEAKGRLLAWDRTLGTAVICSKNGH